MKAERADITSKTSGVKPTGSQPDSRKSRRRSPEEGLISSVTASLEDSLTAEEVARRPGLLQRLDPRVKAATIFLLIVVAALSTHLSLLASLYALTLVIAFASRITPFQITRKTWIIPAMTAVIALPAIFNFVTAGQPLITLYQSSNPGSIGPLTLPSVIAVTEQGARSGALLVLRVTTSATLAILLVLTTEWTMLLKGMRSIGLPKMFVLILGMTYRYIFLFLNTVSNMFLARRSRTVGSLERGDSRRWLMNVSGFLVGKSYHVSNEVYLAMLSRGYDGEPVTIDRFQLEARDYAWTVFAVAAAATGLFANYFWLAV